MSINATYFDTGITCMRQELALFIYVCIALKGQDSFARFLSSSLLFLCQYFLHRPEANIGLLYGLHDKEAFYLDAHALCSVLQSHQKHFDPTMVGISVLVRFPPPSLQHSLCFISSSQKLYFRETLPQHFPTMSGLFARSGYPSTQNQDPCSCRVPYLHLQSFRNDWLR